jgi:hypothetical protein
MELSAIPYLIVSRVLDFGFSQERVYLCLCLVDHLVLGIGLSRDEALNRMTQELRARHGDEYGDAEPCLN